MPDLAMPSHLSRDPFEIFMLIAGLISGVAQAITGATPGSVAAQLPPWMELVWTLMMAFGSALALLGIYRRDGATGLWMEASGLAFVAVSVIFYAVAVVAFLGTETVGKGAFGALTALLFGAACLYRRRQITRTINAAIKAAE